MKIREKVFAYITKGSHLLVFRERGFEGFGLQIPAGTPEEVESLEHAVLREAVEETGLDSLIVVGHLGSVRVDQSEYGIDEVHRRHFYRSSVKKKPLNRGIMWSQIQA
ncbi:MAG: NUDIX domain-containing protein [Candidatus Thorarchaeota archaeon]|nr:MAG: NUDIX domain-containing protein [Candidatus Thorarchaeota archaeon]